MKSVRIPSCRHIDFSPCIPDNPQPPSCKKGHGWSQGCMEQNPCSNYEQGIAYPWSEIKKKYGLETEEGKLDLISELRSDPEFIDGIRRGLEARGFGDRIHWNDVKAELEISMEAEDDR